MKNGTCPKCGSNDIVSDLRIHGGEGHPAYVSIHEPEPEKRPFVWIPKSEQSQFRAYICGACGYTEFYAENYLALNEMKDAKKGSRVLDFETSPSGEFFLFLVTKVKIWMIIGQLLSN